MSDRLKILVFSWNTASIGLCETLNREQKDYNRSGFTTWRWESHIADFWPSLKLQIEKENPDIVVIGFQEDRRPGSYFHSHLLPGEMDNMSYSLLNRSKLLGVGVTSYKNTIKCDPMVRGLRTSVYIRKSLSRRVSGTKRYWDNYNKGSANYVCTSTLTRSKGGNAIYLTIPDIGNLVLINCHLPFNASSLIEAKVKKNPMLRQNELNTTNTAFNNILEKLVYEEDALTKNYGNSGATHIIYFGDFNFRVSECRPASEIANEMIQSYQSGGDKLHDIYLESDELIMQMRKKNIYPLNEGIADVGPTFLPTCKLIKGRRSNIDVVVDEDTRLNLYKDLGFEMVDTPGASASASTSSTEVERYNVGKYDQRIPSWCDRILFSSLIDQKVIDSPEQHRQLECIRYESFDEGITMSRSDHSAVLGVFLL